jgi:hypothetical protein
VRQHRVVEDEAARDADVGEAEEHGREHPLAAMDEEERGGRRHAEAEEDAEEPLLHARVVRDRAQDRTEEGRRRPCRRS